MWEDPDPKVDGCVYDTTDCGHNCKGCDYGVLECVNCGEWIFWPSKVCDVCGECLS